MAISDKIVPNNPANNFATLNPLTPHLGGSSVTLSNGNLNFSASSNPEVYFTFNADNYYFEIIDNISGNNFSLLILSSSNPGIGSTEYYNITNHLRIYYTGVIDKRGSANFTVSSGQLFSIASGDVISVYKKDKSTLILKKNATNETVEINISGLSDDFIIGLISYTSSRSTSYSLNFGADSSFGGAKTSGSANATDANGIGDFYYQPPTGALALCTQNIPEPAISLAQGDSPNKHFIALMWYGSSSSTLSIPRYDTKGPDEDSNQVTSNIAFNPDLVWVKRMGTSSNHVLFDSVRGFGKNTLYTNSTNAETTDENGHVSSVTSNKVNFASGSSGKTNWSGSTNYTVGWFWRAGGPPASDGVAMVDETATTTAALKTAASATITPTRMSVNTTAGFSIIKATFDTSTSASTIPHGLNQAPEVFFIKSLALTYNWSVYHKSIGNTHRLQLNGTGASASYSQAWNNTDPTNQVITIGQQNWHGAGNQIIYAWHSVPGYSAFGSYTGNGSSDGPFVYTGFRPAWVLWKRTQDNGSDWGIVDSTRSPYNVAGQTLYPSTNASENTNDYCDLLSNGFKIRGTSGFQNTDAKNYIYMAFASQSINFSSAR